MDAQAAARAAPTPRESAARSRPLAAQIQYGATVRQPLLHEGSPRLSLTSQKRLTLLESIPETRPRQQLRTTNTTAHVIEYLPRYQTHLRGMCDTARCHDQTTGMQRSDTIAIDIPASHAARSTSAQAKAHGLPDTYANMQALHSWRGRGRTAGSGFPLGHATPDLDQQLPSLGTAQYAPTAQHLVQLAVGEVAIRRINMGQAVIIRGKHGAVRRIRLAVGGRALRRRCTGNPRRQQTGNNQAHTRPELVDFGLQIHIEAETDRPSQKGGGRIPHKLIGWFDQNRGITEPLCDIPGDCQTVCGYTDLMRYALLADVVVVLHLVFILFAVFGGLLTLRWPRCVWVHTAALLWAASVEAFGCVCPLTPLEVHLRLKAGLVGYSGGFVAHYLVPLIYPPGLSRPLQWLLLGALLLINAAVYAWVWHKRRTRVLA